MIYLNNAGTSWPKPDQVYETVQEAFQSEPDQWNDIFEMGLETVTSFFGIDNLDRFLFTTSCTSSLAIALSDFPWKEGGRILISSHEHHALSRWYHKLVNERGLKGTIIPESSDGPLDLNVLEEELKKGVQMVAMTMAGNVTGELLPYKEIVELSHKYGARCLLDGAQIAGLYPIDISTLKPDFFVFAGHKGTMGPQGIGGLYITESVSMVCPSAVCDIGAGKKASVMPTYCDTGSANIAAIAGLTSGINWIKHKGFDELISHRASLRSKLEAALQKMEGVRILGNQDQSLKIGAISIQLLEKDPATVGQKLLENFQIKVGTGFQCAPLAHEALGTHEQGVLRFSAGPMNTEDEIDSLIEALGILI